MSAVCAVSPELEQFRQDCLTRPSHFGYWGDLDLRVWGFSPFGVHRDSDTLARSNWEVISGDLCRRFPEAFEIIHTSHWAVGWMDHLMVDTRVEQALEAAYAWHCKLADYPIADEEHFGNLEYEEACEAYDSWARSDIGRLAEEEQITALLDSEGWFEPSAEQEDVLRGIVTECEMESRGWSDIAARVREAYAA